MGIPVMIIGKSGSGKSCSLRNFKADEVGIFNVASKPFPFKNKNGLKKIDGATYSVITKVLAKPKLKTYVIDDSQYLLAFESFAKANVMGYNKFTEMAVNFYNLIQYVIKQTPLDIIVYFLHHSEKDEFGTRAKTLGKMLDSQLTVEGLFSIVLLADNLKGEHVFITHSDGASTTKTPLEMFEDNVIENDLKVVDTRIRDFYGLNADENKNTETI